MEPPSIPFPDRQVEFENVGRLSQFRRGVARKARHALDHLLNFGSRATLVGPDLGQKYDELIRRPIEHGESASVGEPSIAHCSD